MRGHRITIDTTPWATAALMYLAASGRYGPTPEAVAEELVREGLRVAEERGLIGRSGAIDATRLSAPSPGSGEGAP